MTTEIGEMYRALLAELTALLEGERDLIANAANTSALLYERLHDVNWVGFYFRRHDELVLGPFQGKPACVRIAAGRGVCGSAVQRKQTIIVPDVHAFPGHIACDLASQSELVVPLLCDDLVLGVLDVDSPVRCRFQPVDGYWLEQVMHAFQASTDMDSLLPGLK